LTFLLGLISSHSFIHRLRLLLLLLLLLLVSLDELTVIFVVLANICVFRLLYTNIDIASVRIIVKLLGQLLHLLFILAFLWVFGGCTVVCIACLADVFGIDVFH
jgi:hypothetical protein